MTTAAPAKASGPEQKVSIGSIVVSIWANVHNGRTWRSATIDRRYKDGDEWKSSSSFSVADLPVVIKALEIAFDRLVSLEGPNESPK